LSRAAITLAVAPTIVLPGGFEEYLAGKELLPAVVLEASRRAVQAARRSMTPAATAAYRSDMVEVSVRRCLRSPGGRTRSGTASRKRR
jgi:CO/xanthine dehydrogenase FAD-binding subunit